MSRSVQSHFIYPIIKMENQKLKIGISFALVPNYCTSKKGKKKKLEIKERAKAQ